MINLKSGDFVGYNNQVFWVCRCADNPLNLLRSPSCKWCDMLRPTDAAQQSAQADGEPKTIEEAITKARDAHDWAQVSLLETVRDMRDRRYT